MTRSYAKGLKSDMDNGLNNVMNRRKFSASLAAFSLGAAPLFSLAMPSQPMNAPTPFETHAVYDARLSALTIDVKRYLQQAQQLHTYHGDVAPIWYNTLDQLWAEKSIQLLGITRHSEFFILQTLASECDYIVSHLDKYQDHAIWLMQPRGNSLPAKAETASTASL